MAPGGRGYIEDDGGWVLNRHMSHRAEAMLTSARQPVEKGVAIPGSHALMMAMC